MIKPAFISGLECRYLDGCSGNTKRIIRRKAATLATRGGEVFYKKAGKDSAGKKVLQQLYCYKQQYIEILQFFTTQVVQEVRYIRSSEERQQIMRACHVEPPFFNDVHVSLYIPVQYVYNYYDHFYYITSQRH